MSSVIKVNSKQGVTGSEYRITLNENKKCKTIVRARTKQMNQNKTQTNHYDRQPRLNKAQRNRRTIYKTDNKKAGNT